MAHRDGRTDDARAMIDEILASRPHWKANPRREIGKLITDTTLADRLARELTDAGLT